MSIHPSLKVASRATASTRNVLKRYERVRQMFSQDRWAEGQSVFGLPKLKQMRIRTRKASSKEKEAAATEKPAAVPAAGAASS